MPADTMWGILGVLLGPAMAVVVHRLTGGRALSEPAWSGRNHVPTRRIAAIAVVAGLTLGLLGVRFAGSSALPAWCWLAVTGIVLVLVDLECHRLPRAVVAAMVLGGLLLLATAAFFQGDTDPLVRAVAAAIVLFLGALVVAILAAPHLGGGDVSLYGAVGLYLGWAGWHQVLLGLGLSLLLAATTAVLLVAGHRISVRDQFAMGPAIIGGALIALVLP
jgi:leader peptidase (prepilin peptidase)/N-methyltransferase